MLVVNEIKERGLQAVVEDYALELSETDDRVCLNYNQIYSSKVQQANECRGLILEKGTWDIVCRPFTRFFNYGENSAGEGLDFSNCTIAEKLDGSLIKIYHYKGEWRWASRGTVEGNNAIFYRFGDELTFGVVFKSAMYIATGCNTVNELAEKYNLNPLNTYLFEIITPYNKIVVNYGKDVYRLVYLSTVNKSTGEVSIDLDQYPDRAKLYEFGKNDTVEHIISMADGFGANQEGFVVYDETNTPVCKIKGSLYVKLHYIRGNGFTPKVALKLLLDNEVDEYLTYFPEDKEYIDDMRNAINYFIDRFAVFNDSILDWTNKDIGLAVKDGSIYEHEYLNNLSQTVKEIFVKMVFMIRSGKIEGYWDYLHKTSDSRRGLRDNSDILAEYLDKRDKN